MPVDAEGTSSCSISLRELRRACSIQSVQLSALTSSWRLPPPPAQCESQSPAWAWAVSTFNQHPRLATLAPLPGPLKATTVALRKGAGGGGASRWPPTHLESGLRGTGQAPTLIGGKSVEKSGFDRLKATDSDGVS